MKKTFFAAFIIFFFSLPAFSQEYFFYSYKEKRTLNPVSNYISVKFRNDISLSQSSSIIQQVFGSNMDSKYNVNYVYDNKEKANIVIVKIKNNVSAKSIDNIKSQLLNSSSVEYSGMCFKKNDRVLHFTTDELIVKFSRSVSTTDIQNLNRLYNTTIIEKVDLMEGLYLIKINNKGESGADNVFDASNKFTLTPFVEYAQPNFIRQGMLESADNSVLNRPSQKKSGSIQLKQSPGCFPNDSMAPMMWNLRNTGSNVPNNIQGVPGCDLNIVDAWCVTTGSPRVLMGIVDTGVDTNHVDLIGNLCDRNLWWDFINNTPHQFDEYYHGTGVAGITSAVGNNHIGTVGVAYTCKILPVRVFGSIQSGGYTTDLILGKGLIWAWTRGAAVINCSWGGGIDTPLITNAIRDARHYGRNGKGTVICAGSGNDDTTAVLYPSQMHEVMSIGGLSPCNERKSKHSCDFNSLDSNTQFWGASYGDSLTMVAPCTLIGITIPGLTIPDSGWCYCGNGTSDSSPMAAAVAGLMISKNINISADSVMMIMEQTCDKVGNYSYNINKQNGAWNFEMGYGRLDTKRALDMVPSGPSQINDQVPPVIKIFPPESQVFNSPITFTAQITDNDSVAQGSNMPRLYYYTLSQPNIQSAPGVSLGNNMYKFTFPDFPRLHLSSPVFYYIAAQDYSSPPNVSTYPIGGRGYNPPGNVKPSKFMYLRNTPVIDTSFTASNVPIQIPANTLSTTYSTFNCNFTQTILKLTCWVNIQHTFDEDITVSLISPAGTETVLAGGVGHDGHNFTFTYFDDDASTAIDTMINHSPFTGTYKPIYKLWLLDGEGISGTWKLKVVDNGFDNGGSILGWGFNVKYSTYGDNILVPDKFALLGNYPNPFNPVTRVVFNVPYISNVKIKLYDILGRQVATLLDETRQPGFQEYVDFSSNDVTVHGGTGLASGVYFITLTGNDTFIESKKMVLVK